ncbi:NAD-dependent epimerase/dehydratase family protein [Spirochaeta lutea]|uniref:NAD-dependent epimerase/dehydratase domain-containing protein n=1 Tax=Spirochaeta lutea TaxID=1480694 RepID=A0A098QUU9_9SPIO|nr:NAD-dependent epimerase/dehydratase family protein [Spirochaeta lutea]KGE71188.1 hypothetical protein DC28_12030 [Spirochaeta lutea]
MELHTIFGTGPLGLFTARALLEDGKRVRVVNRTGTLDAPRALVMAPWTAADVEVVQGDALDPGQVRAAAQGASHIYHCANPLYHQWAELLPPMQTNVIAAALEQKAVLGLTENLYMYARGVSPITLQTPVDPPTRKGRIRQELHEQLLRAQAEDGLVWTSIRGSDYYGPGATGQSVFGTDYFLNPLIQSKRVSLMGDPDALHSYTYAGDFGRALVLAVRSPRAHGKAWIVAHREKTTTRDVALEFRKQAGSRSTIGRLPTGMLRLLGLVNPQVRELLEMMYQKQEAYLVSGEDFEREFGFVPVSLQEGVASTLEWYRMWRAQRGD